MTLYFVCHCCNKSVGRELVGDELAQYRDAERQKRYLAKFCQECSVFPLKDSFPTERLLKEERIRSILI